MKTGANKENNVFTYNIKQYSRVLSDFVNSKVSFKVIHNGSSLSIVWDEKTWRFVDYGGVAGKGFHLSKIVNKEAMEFVLKNPTIYPPKEDGLVDNTDLEVQKANIKALKKHEGEQIYCVDVCDCYWDTAHKMGVISQKTYLTGLKNKEWKTGRNASIGALSKNIIETTFVNGARVSTLPQKPKIDLSGIRDAIVKQVHESFLKILKELDNNWLMYFTDCVYVPAFEGDYLKTINQVQAYFEGLGYQTKLTTFHLDEVDIESGKIKWHDYQKNKTKGFIFAQRQKTLDAHSLFSKHNFIYDKKLHELDLKKLQENKEFLKE